MSRRLRFQIKPNVNLSTSTGESQSKANVNLSATSGENQSKSNANLSTSTGESQIKTNVNLSVSTGANQTKTDDPSSSTADGRNKSNDLSISTADGQINSNNENLSTAASAEGQETGTKEIGCVEPTVEEDVCVDSEKRAELVDDGREEPKDAESEENPTSSASTSQVGQCDSSVDAETEIQLQTQTDIQPQTQAQSQTQTGTQNAMDWRVMRNHLKGKELDRKSFLMKDLIYWNPEEKKDEKANDETKDTEQDAQSSSGKKRVSRKRSSVQSAHPDESATETSSKRDSRSAETKLSMPQVKVNADGSIAIDETSLVVDRRDQGTEMDDLETIDESALHRNGPKITSMSFRRNRLPPRGKMWSTFETDKFYRIMAFTGLDFQLMHELFPDRSRVELKRKYKKELTDNPGRIDHAMTSKIGRIGPWMDLKKMVIERGQCANDERGRALLDTAKDLIEEEDERIEFEIGKRKPSVAEATKIADRLSKGGFGGREFDDDVTEGELDAMAQKIIKNLAKQDRIEEVRAEKLQKSNEESKRRRAGYHVKTRTSSSFKSENMSN